MVSPGSRRSAWSVPPPPFDCGSMCARMARASCMCDVLLRGVRGVLCGALYRTAFASPCMNLDDSWTCMAAACVSCGPVRVSGPAASAGTIAELRTVKMCIRCLFKKVSRTRVVCAAVGQYFVENNLTWS